MSTTNPTWPLPEPDAIGPIRGADDVREAVLATVDLWSPFYLGVISQRLAATDRIGGKGQPKNPLPGFGHWRNTPDYRALGSRQPAAFMVTVGSTLKDPDVKGTGLVVATWRAQVSIVVFGTTWQEAADLTAWYEKAVLLSVLQHRGLGGIAQATKWAGSGYAPLEHTSTRTVQKAAVLFDVTLANVLDVTRGPSVPPPSGTPGQDETAETVTATLTKIPITEPL